MPPGEKCGILSLKFGEMPREVSMVQKTAVAMSGGVDSSAAAVLLQGEGRALTGLTLTLFPGEGDAPADAARPSPTGFWTCPGSSPGR